MGRGTASQATVQHPESRNTSRAAGKSRAATVSCVSSAGWVLSLVRRGDHAGAPSALALLAGLVVKRFLEPERRARSPVQSVSRLAASRSASARRGLLPPRLRPGRRRVRSRGRVGLAGLVASSGAVRRPQDRPADGLDRLRRGLRELEAVEDDRHHAEPLPACEDARLGGRAACFAISLSRSSSSSPSSRPTAIDAFAVSSSVFLSRSGIDFRRLPISGSSSNSFSTRTVLPDSDNHEVLRIWSPSGKSFPCTFSHRAARSTSGTSAARHCARSLR